MKKGFPWVLTAATLAGPACVQAQVIAGEFWKPVAALDQPGGDRPLLRAYPKWAGESEPSPMARELNALLGWDEAASSRAWPSHSGSGLRPESSSAAGGRTGLSRGTKDVLFYYGWDSRWRLGAGTRRSAASVAASGKLIPGTASATLRAPAGPVLELQYLLAHDLSIGGGAGGVSLKWADEKFRPKDGATLERDRQHLSVSLFASF